MTSQRSNSSRRRNSSSRSNSLQDDVITSSYRSAFGGPAGPSIDSWTSKISSGGLSSGSTTPDSISRQQSISRGTRYGGARVLFETSPKSSSSAAAAASSNSTGKSSTVNSLARRLESAVIAETVALGTSATEMAMGVSTPGTRPRSSPSTASNATSSLECKEFEYAVDASQSTTLNRPPSRSLSLEQRKYTARASLVQPGAPKHGDVSPMAYAAGESSENATSRVGAVISSLTTGNTKEQLTAAEALLLSARCHGEPLRDAIYRAGGAHMLQQVLLATWDPKVQNACAAALAEVSLHPDALVEVTTGQGPSSASTRRMVEVTLEGVCAGREPFKDLFIRLVASNSDAVHAVCAELKVLRTLTDVLVSTNGTAGGASVRTKAAAMACLEALCEIDAGKSLRKLGWGGGLVKIAATLDQAPLRSSALRLLLKAVALDVRHVHTLFNVVSIKTLASLVADAEYTLPVQAAAARILSLIAALPTRREDSTQALLDYVLPRACEVLRRARDQMRNEAALSSLEVNCARNAKPLVSLMPPRVLAALLLENGEGSTTGAKADRFYIEGQLYASCASLVGHLTKISRLCCHVVIFHAEVLGPLVALLAGSAQCQLAAEVLHVTSAYAACPDAMQQ